jgi:integrase
VKCGHAKKTPIVIWRGCYVITRDNAPGNGKNDRELHSACGVSTSSNWHRARRRRKSAISGDGEDDDVGGESMTGAAIAHGAAGERVAVRPVPPPGGGKGKAAIQSFLSRSETCPLFNFSFRFLRHTATTLLKMCGAAEATVREFGGHSATVSRLYTHVEERHKREALAKLAAIDLVGLAKQPA